MFISQLMLEITRRCNMCCAHCLRGDAQDLDMSEEIIRKAMEPFEGIGTLTFSGGEPTLNIGAMRYALKFAKEKGIPINGFYVVTNGKVVTDEFITLMMQWDTYCKTCNWGFGDPIIVQDEIPSMIKYSGEEYSSGVALSQEQFHEPIPKENVFKLQSLGCFKENDKNFFTGASYIAMGRAADPFNTDFWGETRKLDEESSSEIYIDDGQIEELYINALGDFQGCCDFSYEVQEQHSKGSVLDGDWVSKLVEKAKAAA